MLSLSMLLRLCARRASLVAFAAALVSFALLTPGADAISGVCPDGSIYIVQRTASIPCRDSKQVEPGDIPPIKPEFLPRPYGWEVFNRETDPNNPYNLVEIAPLAPPPEAPPEAKPRPAPVESERAPQATPTADTLARAAPQRAPQGLELGLSANDLQNLLAIIEISQDRAPATFVQRDDDGPRGVTLQLANSEVFSSRVANALLRRGAPTGLTVAFHALASERGNFFGNLTFVQGHMAFHPDESDPAQFGLLMGQLGRLAPGDAVLGYAVLPTSFDLAKPVDVYWDDQLFTARLSP